MFGKMKRLFVRICIVSLVCSVQMFHVCAEGLITHTTENGFQYILQEDGIAKIINYIGNADKLIIPKTLDNYAVTAIGRQAFCGNPFIVELEVGEHITYIGYEAFARCEALERVTVCGEKTWETEYTSYRAVGPSQMNGMFVYCKKLTDLQLENLRTIPGGFTYGCISMRTVTIPPTVHTIGDEALGYWKDKSAGILEEACIIGYCGGAVEEYYAMTHRIIKYRCIGNLRQMYPMDVNQDEVVNAEDALMVLEGACGLRKLNYNENTLGDVNQDERINATDALLILQEAAGF